MVEFIGEKTREIPEFRVKYKDVYHLKNLYIMLHEYLLDEGFYAPNDDDSHSKLETLYLEKQIQKGVNQGGKEMWVWWRTVKAVEGKYSPYFRAHLDIDFHMVATGDREVLHEGKKVKANFGEIEIFFRPWIETDYKGRWKNHWFLKHIKDLYNMRIMSHELDKREKDLWREAYRVQGQVKKFLDLRQFIPTPDPFHPNKLGMEG